MPSAAVELPEAKIALSEIAVAAIAPATPATSANFASGRELSGSPMRASMRRF
jgi:hypothetical protein